jgi:type IV pilus assembly protein PilV
VRSPDDGGFTLIEVLVAVCVLAVGVLGAVTAQATALHTRHASALLSNGVQLASSLADRMRANRAQMRLGDAGNAYLQLRFDAAQGAPGAAPSDCLAVGCDSAAIAAFDSAEVRQALHAGFPGARLAVCRDASGGAAGWDCAGSKRDPIVIKLGWRDGAAPVQPLVAIVLAGEAE